MCDWMSAIYPAYQGWRSLKFTHFLFIFLFFFILFYSFFLFCITDMVCRSLLPLCSEVSVSFLFGGHNVKNLALRDKNMTNNIRQWYSQTTAMGSSEGGQEKLQHQISLVLTENVLSEYCNLPQVIRKSKLIFV